MVRHLLSTARGTTSFLKQFSRRQVIGRTDRRPRHHSETICSPCIRSKCLRLLVSSTRSWRMAVEPMSRSKSAIISPAALSRLRSSANIRQIASSRGTTSTKLRKLPSLHSSLLWTLDPYTPLVEFSQRYDAHTHAFGQKSIETIYQLRHAVHVVDGPVRIDQIASRALRVRLRPRTGKPSLVDHPLQFCGVSTSLPASGRRLRELDTFLVRERRLKRQSFWTGSPLFDVQRFLRHDDASE